MAVLLCFFPAAWGQKLVAGEKADRECEGEFSLQRPQRRPLGGLDEIIGRA